MSSIRRIWTKGVLAPLFAVAALAGGAAAPQPARAVTIVQPYISHSTYTPPPIDAQAETKLETLLSDPATKREDLVPYTRPYADTRLHERALKYEEGCRAKVGADGGDLISCMEDRDSLRTVEVAGGIGLGLIGGVMGLVMLGGRDRRR